MAMEKIYNKDYIFKIIVKGLKIACLLQVTFSICISLIYSSDIHGI